MKHCRGCSTDKPISEFHKDKARPDGLQYYCKGCVRQMNKVCRLKGPASCVLTKRVEKQIASTLKKQADRIRELEAQACVGPRRLISELIAATTDYLNITQ